MNGAFVIQFGVSHSNSYQRFNYNIMPASAVFPDSESVSVHLNRRYLDLGALLYKGSINNTRDFAQMLPGIKVETSALNGPKWSQNTRSTLFHIFTRTISRVANFNPINLTNNRF